MKLITRVRRILPALLGALVLSVALFPVSMTSSRSTSAAAADQYLTAYEQFHTTLVRNFNPFAPTALDFTTGAIYEPLMIITTAGPGHTYPWLATSYKFTDGNTSLVVTIRQGVKWSDGQPFSAKDVAFTFNYGKQNAVADQNGLWSSGFLKSVTAMGADQVVFHFAGVDTTILPNILSNVKILPEHVWATVKSPATYTNPDPVGTGPFTQITQFSSQEYTLGKNPYYWQPGKPAYAGIRVPLYTGNDSVAFALVHGDLDWTGAFVANIQNVYVKRDPAHFHYFYDVTQPPGGLYFNDQMYPFSLVGFRKAISYAIDRATVWHVAQFGYQPPADAIGITNPWPSWADPSLTKQAKDLATYSPAKAKALLAQLGFTWKSGQLYSPKGQRVVIQLSVPVGWTGSVLTCQIMQKNLAAIGIDASVKLRDLAGWQDQGGKGLLSAIYPQSPNGGATPYYYFYSYMSKQSYVATGQNATTNGQQNFERFQSDEATNLLAQFRQITDLAMQHTIIDKLQKIQLDQLPFIPVIYGAYWYTYSTKNFTGWPTPSNDYVIGSPWQYPENAKVMTTITPVM